MENALSKEEPGSASFGKYQLFATLGRGGMADVFLAVARGPMGFNKLTVIKRLRSDLASDPAFLNMLLDEARLAARLSHPNVVHTYEVGDHHGVYFIAMEYLEGQPLNKIVKTALKDSEGLEPPLCARVISDALSGLHHAHELRDYDGSPLKIIHRDVSPHNIFVTYDGQVKLMDFGIAKAASSSTQTEVGVLKGKVAYMAPEQATGGEVDRRADIFSMGIVLWEALTQQRLYSSPSAAATLHKLLTLDAPRVSSLVPTIDPKLDEIVAKALQKDPAARFQTAAEMRNALEGYINGTGRIVRQEEIGQRVNDMFRETRDHVRGQIQAHMGAVNLATNTSELMALNMDSLKKFDAAVSSASGRGLLDLGSESGSGSGVVSASNPDAPPQSMARPATKPRRRGAWIAVAVLLLFGVTALAMRYGKHGAIGPSAANPGVVEPGPGLTAAAPISPATVTAAIAPGTATAAIAPTAASSTIATPATATGATAAITATATAARTPPRESSRHAPAPTPSPAKPPPPAVTAPPADEGTGFVTLDTYPWTRVSEGGRVLGVTPLIRQPLSAGAHMLTLENPEQGIKQSYPVTIKAGETVSRRLGLK